MTHQFNPTILREYDIRGVVGDTLTEADAYALGRTYAAKAHGEGARTIAVGRDGRTHSPSLEAELVRGLTEGGMNLRPECTVRMAFARSVCDMALRR